MRISTRKLFLMTLLFGFLLAPAMNATAQIRRITGKVTNEKGEPIVGAKVMFQQTDGNGARNIDTKTDKRGEYTWILGIQGGTFRIIVHAIGYEPTWKENVTPEVGETKEEHFKLKPGDDYKSPWEMSEKERADLIKLSKDIEKKNQEIGAAKGIIDKVSKMMSENKFVEAIEEANKGIEGLLKTPGDKNDKAAAFLYVKIGECNLKLAGDEPNVDKQKLKNALTAYESAVKLQPKNAEIMMNFGIVLIKNGENDKANVIFKKLTEDSTAANAQAYYAIAVTMINKDQPPEAIIPVLRKGLALDQNHAESVYELGRILCGNPETTAEGIELLKKYLTIGKSKNNKLIAEEIIKALEAAK
jgi:Flp pilus assembly protein TadD